MHSALRIVVVNVLALIYTVLLARTYERRYLALLFLALRACFATFVYTVDASVLQDLGIATLIALYTNCSYGCLGKNAGWLREFVIVGIASWHVYCFLSHHYLWDALVSYLVLDALTYLRFRREPLPAFLEKTLFVELLACDAREYVVILYYDIDKHFPTTFFLHLQFPTPYALAPCIHRYFTKRRILVLLLVLAIVNALHVPQLGRLVETGTRLDELAIRLATNISILLALRKRNE